LLGGSNEEVADGEVAEGEDGEVAEVGEVGAEADDGAVWLRES